MKLLGFERGITIHAGLPIPITTPAGWRKHAQRLTSQVCSPSSHEVTAMPEKLTPTEARQGEKQPIVSHVLVVSTILAVLALLAVWFFVV
jgi:hypothetical protein